MAFYIGYIILQNVPITQLTLDVKRTKKGDNKNSLSLLCVCSWMLHKSVIAAINGCVMLTIFPSHDHNLVAINYVQIHGKSTYYPT